MDLVEAQNKKHTLKWIANNREKYNKRLREYMKLNYDDEKPQKKREYYYKIKNIGDLRELPFFNSETFDL